MTDFLWAGRIAMMELHYFAFDNKNTLWKVPRQKAESLWQGRITSRELDFPLGDEARVISVVCDEKLLPKISFFLKVHLEAGRVVDESRLDVYEAISNTTGRRYDHPAAHEQFVGWPADWQQQLAVALDVPISQLSKIGLGGPVVMADLWGISPDQVLEYFEISGGE